MRGAGLCLETGSGHLGCPLSEDWTSIPDQLYEQKWQYPLIMALMMMFERLILNLVRACNLLLGDRYYGSFTLKHYMDNCESYINIITKYLLI